MYQDHIFKDCVKTLDTLPKYANCDDSGNMVNYSNCSKFQTLEK